ncbi:DNA polymerase III subunit gamma and tau [Propionibacterium australiense]|nr:DNA polymerase III subunit gamma and tau [Propionibacterium australiense]RLP10230.1 DNA polymerase III subunit gamma and tau [Propionibacterium australiense]
MIGEPLVDTELDEAESVEASIEEGFDPDDPALGEPDDDADDGEGPVAEITEPVFAPGPDEEAELERRAEQEASQAQLALYRRYRPDTFAEVIGQEHVTEPLMRAIANGRVHHAYLFSGPRGCGKTTSARILARCLNCEQGPTPTPCGHCRSCRDLATGGPGSIDVIEIDAASHGGVDDARDLREGVYFAPVHSRHKIYIIDEAHMVTPAGFNALLKVVEEPPAHVKFIFATTEPDKVIGTIRSRTHHYPFRLVPPKVLTGYLQRICDEEHVRVESGVLPLVVQAGAGSVRDSLSVLDQLLGAAGEDGVGYRQAAALLGHTPDALLDEMVDAFAAGDGRGVFGTVDRVIEIGQDPRRFAEDLLSRLRDLVIIAQVPDALSSGLIDVAPDLADRLNQQAVRFGAGELTRAAQVIAQGLTQMRGTTAPRLYLELMCARVLVPGADASEGGITARLDRLERRLGVPAAGGEPPAQAPARQQTSPVPAQAPSRPPAPAPQETARPPAPQQPPAQGPAAGHGRPPAPGQAQDPRRPAGQAPATQPPAAQRPAGQRPAGQPPAGSPAPAGRPAPQAPDQPASAPQAGIAQVTTGQLRQMWPQVLEAVKGRRRFAWMILGPNAQVLDVNAGRLTLAFNNPGARESFVSHGGADVLHDALVATLGADLEIDTVIEGQAAVNDLQQRGGPPPGGGDPRPFEPASAQAGQQPTDPADAPDDPPVHDPWAVQPGPADPAPPSQPAPAQEETAPAAVRHHVVPAPQEAEDQEYDPDADVSMDDVMIEDSDKSATQLLIDELGAELIEEVPNEPRS